MPDIVGLPDPMLLCCNYKNRCNKKCNKTIETETLDTTVFSGDKKENVAMLQAKPPDVYTHTPDDRKAPNV